VPARFLRVDDFGVIGFVFHSHGHDRIGKSADGTDMHRADNDAADLGKSLRIQPSEHIACILVDVRRVPIETARPARMMRIHIKRATEIVEDDLREIRVEAKQRAHILSGGRRRKGGHGRAILQMGEKDQKQEKDDQEEDAAANASPTVASAAAVTAAPASAVTAASPAVAAASAAAAATAGAA